MDQLEKTAVVWLILNGRAGEALDRLAESFGIMPPRLKVGLPKGRKKQVLGCYDVETKTIRVLDSSRLADPFVVLHEFYHHLRTDVSKRHRGTERHANEFAKGFMYAYKNAQIARSTEKKE